MSYKKLVSLFAVSALALGACGANDAEETPETDDTEQQEDVEDTDTDADATDDAASSDDLIEQAKQASGDAFPAYGLTVTGAWTVDGYVIQHPAGEAATIPVSIISEEDEYNVYLLEDGVITQVVSNEPAVEFVVEDPSADASYVAGVSPEDLGAVGDELSAEDFERYENVVLEAAAAEEEAAE